MKIVHQDGRVEELTVREQLRRAHRRPRITGLGDLVALFAQPMAWLLDRLLGTHLSGCAACARRRRELNRWSALVARLWRIWRGRGAAVARLRRRNPAAATPQPPTPPASSHPFQG